MTATQHETDICIIGAGPVGLSAIFQCGMLKLRCHVVDALPAIGGQCSALYPEKPIYDIAAYPRILAGDLVDALAQQADPFEPTYHLGQSVVSLMQDKDGLFYLVTSLGQEIIAKAVILAAGPGAFGPNKPPLECIEAFEPVSVHYMIRNKACFTDQTLVIAGGGDSAVDWAISLADIAKKIYFVHRRDKFRAAPDSVAKLQALFDTGKIESRIPSQLKGVFGDAPHLNTVQIDDLKGNVAAIKADHLLCFYGLAQDLGAIRNWDLDIEGFHIKIDPTTAQTSRRGIYAIGDIATYPNKLKLIMTGFAEGAQAAHHAYSYIYPDTALHFEYSTTKGIPTI